MSAIDLARVSLKSDEELRLKVYRCTANKNSIGYGRNLDDKGITQSEAELLLDNDLAECIQDLATFYWWNDLTDIRQAALINLRFNLGPARFRGFKKMIKALEMRDYTEAAYQILDSNYAKQVGMRAERVAEALK